MEFSNTEQLVNKVGKNLKRKNLTSEERRIMAQELMHLALIFTEMYERGRCISAAKNTK